VSSALTLEDLAAQVRALTVAVDELDPHPQPAPDGAADRLSDAKSPPRTYFPDLESWVLGYFTPSFGRTLGGELRWCPAWWDHVEAISRLEALWRAWEQLRLDPQLGMASWYRDHLDHHLPILLGSRGPFARCTPDRHEPDHPLPTRAAPGGWWDLDEEPVS
jgi:hypothetical protein